MANLKIGEIVLDIGSGGGIDAFLASNRVGPTGEVIGVDMTPAMLDRRGQQLRERELKMLNFVTARLKKFLWMTARSM